MVKAPLLHSFQNAALIDLHVLTHRDSAMLRWPQRCRLYPVGCRAHCDPLRIGRVLAAKSALLCTGGQEDRHPLP